jgi:hypothetical protein
MRATQTLEAIRAFGEHEHRDLAWGLGRIHEAASSLGAGSQVEARRAIREVVAWSAASPRFDHGQIAAMVARLRLDEADATHAMTPTTVNELRCHLFALEALLRSHIDREEKLLLPILKDSELHS